MNDSLFRSPSSVSQNQLGSRIASAASQRTPIPCCKQAYILNNQTAPLVCESCHFALFLISAGAGPLPAAREFAPWHFLSASSHGPSSALLSLLLAALTPILGSGDLSCLLLLLKMEFAFLFPILLVAFGCSPA